MSRGLLAFILTVLRPLLIIDVTVCRSTTVTALSCLLLCSAKKLMY